MAVLRVCRGRSGGCERDEKRETERREMESERRPGETRRSRRVAQNDGLGRRGTEVTHRSYVLECTTPARSPVCLPLFLC
eukprot:3914166-Prymnesium_polylepis.1